MVNKDFRIMSALGTDICSCYDCHQHTQWTRLPDSSGQLSDEMLNGEVIGKHGIASEAPRLSVNCHTVLPLVLL